MEDIEWPLVRNVRTILARRHGFDPADRQAIDMWDTSLNSLMFDRMIGRMRDFFTIPLLSCQILTKFVPGPSLVCITASLELLHILRCSQFLPGAHPGGPGTD